VVTEVYYYPFLATRVQADYTWEGTTSSDPTVATNWNGTPPTLGASNNGDLIVVNGANNTLIFNQGAGSTTTFTNQFLVGDTDAPGGSMMVTSGAVTFNAGAGDGGIIGQNNGQTSTLTINGGTFTYNGSGIYLGNNSSSTGIIDISSGAFNINAAFTPGSDGDDFVLGRQNATGEVNLSGTGTITLTATTAVDAAFTFDGSADFINFDPNYTGSISLSNDGVNGSTETTFDSSIAAGNIQIGGTTTGVTDSSFTVTSENGYDVYTVAPEPTSVVLLIGGLGILVFIQRRFRSIV
jgi:hypothetical protein